MLEFTASGFFNNIRSRNFSPVEHTLAESYIKYRTLYAEMHHKHSAARVVSKVDLYIDEVSTKPTAYYYDHLIDDLGRGLSLCDTYRSEVATLKEEVRCASFLKRFKYLFTGVMFE